jgi:hypothetical protein
MPVKVDRPLFFDVHQLIDEAILKKKKKSKKMKVAPERYTAIPETTQGVAIPARHLAAPPPPRRIEALVEELAAPPPTPAAKKRRTGLTPEQRALRAATERQRELRAAEAAPPKAKAVRKPRAKAAKSDNEAEKPSTPAKPAKSDSEVERALTAPRAARMSRTGTDSDAPGKAVNKQLFPLESKAKPRSAMPPPAKRDPVAQSKQPRKAAAERKAVEFKTDNSDTGGGMLKKKHTKKRAIL